MTTTTRTKNPPTKAVKRAASIIWSRTEMSQEDAIDLATSVLNAALRRDHIAKALWNMDQNAQTAAPRSWNAAMPEERLPYLETAAEYRDAVIPRQVGY